MKTRTRFILAGLISTLLLPQLATAQVPQLVNYQGRVAVGTVNFEGAGSFRFALVNAAGTTTYWGSSADTAPADGVPDTAVALTVTKGLYSVLLGDTSVANMAAIPASVWTNADVRLRVWFNDGVNGNQLLTPDQRIAPTGYIADGSITSAKLAPNLTLAGATSLTGVLDIGPETTRSPPPRKTRMAMARPISSSSPPASRPPTRNRDSCSHSPPSSASPRRKRPSFPPSSPVAPIPWNTETLSPAGVGSRSPALRKATQATNAPSPTPPPQARRSFTA